MQLIFCCYPIRIYQAEIAYRPHRLSIDQTAGYSYLSLELILFQKLDLTTEFKTVFV